MTIAALKQAEWHARRVARGLGWPGLAGLLLLMGTVAFVLLVLKPMQREVADIRSEANELHTRAATRHALKADTPAAQLDAFYRFFPEGGSLADTLGKVYDAAAAQNLALEQGEYRLAAEHDARLQRYDLVFPVRGQYTQIRRFVAQVLKDVPSLALEGVNFNRQNAGDIGVEAQVRLTLYLRGEHG